MSLLSLAACGAPAEEAHARPLPTSGARLEATASAWRTEGVYTGGAGGMASSIYTLMPTGDEKAKGLVIASWHAENYHGRVERLRFTGAASAAASEQR